MRIALAIVGMAMLLNIAVWEFIIQFYTALLGIKGFIPADTLTGYRLG